MSRADITSKYAEKVRRGTELIDSLEARVKHLKTLDAKPAPLPKGLGTVLIDRFCIEPGPALGTLMARLASDVENGLIGVQESYDHYIAYIEQHPELIGEA